MSLRPAEVAPLLHELQPLVERRATKVWTPTGTSVVLRLKGPGAQDDLLIEVAHPRARLGVVQERPRGEPSSFQAQLRAALEGCRLVSLAQQVEGDRVVALSFGHREGGAHLIAELLGSRGNLLLLDADGLLLAAARPERLPRRGLALGEAYAPPPAREAGEGEPARWRGGEGEFPISAALEAAYGPLDREALVADARRALRKSLGRARKKQERIVEQLEAAVAAAAEAPRIQQQGELLKSALGRMKRGQVEVEVVDYYDPGAPRIRLPLDPKLGPKENLEAYFRRARKLQRGAEVAGERLARAHDREAGLALLLEEVEAAGTPEALEALWREARPFGVRRPAPPPVGGRSAEKAAPRRPHRTFLASNGDRILVGRSARDNHALTFTVARGNDLWLHVRDWPGSHVVIQASGGRKDAEVDPTTLLEAGLLAAHFSDGREAGAVEITFTERKHLRHPPGAAPGLVSVAKGRSLRVVPDPARLEALFGREE
ncbi:MAG: NFACT RNA binding domain-containing protein [Deltaproteobacteria bacterium]|nr:NFACT RNA binding domain-containing protein [Deltaproteobacteria bacterium]